MRLMIADYYLDSSVLTVASLRMASYAPSGTFISRVLDGVSRTGEPRHGLARPGVDFSFYQREIGKYAGLGCDMDANAGVARRQARAC